MKLILVYRVSLDALLLVMLKIAWNMAPISSAELHQERKVRTTKWKIVGCSWILTTISGEHLGLPLLPDLRKAKEQLKPDATAVFVAAPHCGKAIEDAIEAEIPLIVAVAEHIPLHDILRVSLHLLYVADRQLLISSRYQAFLRHNLNHV